MPVRGRLEQSVEAMMRLINTASYPAMYFVVGGQEDDDVITAVAEKTHAMPMRIDSPKATYWEGLAHVTKIFEDNTLVCNVANDVLPSMHWLRNALHDYNGFGHDPIIGFNGDGYTSTRGHSCHFLISMKRIRQYGGWPVWYKHNFGDTEIVARAIEGNAYYKSPWAVLFHNHHSVGVNGLDAVYTEGNETFIADKQTFDLRKRNRWYQGKS